MVQNKVTTAACYCPFHWYMVDAGQSKICAKYDNFTERITQNSDHMTLPVPSRRNEYRSSRSEEKRKDTISSEASGYAVKQPIKDGRVGQTWLASNPVLVSVTGCFLVKTPISWKELSKVHLWVGCYKQNWVSYDTSVEHKKHCSTEAQKTSVSGKSQHEEILPSVGLAVSDSSKQWVNHFYGMLPLATSDWSAKA